MTTLMGRIDKWLDGPRSSVAVIMIACVVLGVLTGAVAGGPDVMACLAPLIITVPLGIGTSAVWQVVLIVEPRRLRSA